MKAKLFFSIVVLIIVVQGALAAGNQGETNVHAESSRLTVAPVEQGAFTNVQTGPGVVADDSKPASPDFDATFIAITDKFSGTVAAIADAIKRGELTNTLRMNAGAKRILALFPGCDSGTPHNGVRIVFDPLGLRPFIENWDVVAAHILRRKSPPV
jgi:hypothetical protein